MLETADIPSPLPSAPTSYTDPRAHELRERYLATYGGDEIPVPVESVAEDLIGLRIEEDDLGECSGMLIPAKRLIRVNAAEAMRVAVRCRTAVSIRRLSIARPLR